MQIGIGKFDNSWSPVHFTGLGFRDTFENFCDRILPTGLKRQTARTDSNSENQVPELLGSA